MKFLDKHSLKNLKRTQPEQTGRGGLEVLEQILQFAKPIHSPALF